MFAGYLKRFPFDNKFNKSKYLIYYLLCALINVISLFALKLLNIHIIDSTFLYNYYSVTVLIESICLFLFFKNLKINNIIIVKIVSFISTTTFGIYLIHENPCIREILWSSLSFILNYSILYVLILLVIIPIVLFLAFSFIDKIRTLIFNKISFKINDKLKIMKFLKSVEEIVNYES